MKREKKQQPKMDSSVVSGVCGVFSILIQFVTSNFYLLLIGLLLGVIGILLAARELKEAKASGEPNIMAVVAITLSITGTALCGLPLIGTVIYRIFENVAKSAVQDLTNLS